MQVVLQRLSGCFRAAPGLAGQADTWPGSTSSCVASTMATAPDSYSGGSRFESEAAYFGRVAEPAYAAGSNPATPCGFESRLAYAAGKAVLRILARSPLWEEQVR